MVTVNDKEEVAAFKDFTLSDSSAQTSTEPAAVPTPSKPTPQPSTTKTTTSEVSSISTSSASSTGRVVASPLARKLARDAGIDMANIRGMFPLYNTTR